MPQYASMLEHEFVRGKNDDCIADVFESISSRHQNEGLLKYDLHHFVWVQRHFGLIMIAVEVSHLHNSKRSSNIDFESKWSLSLLDVLLR